MIALTLYTQTGCHLCDQMKAVVERVASRVPLALKEVDIDGDPSLEARYGHDIPVLVADGTEIARHRIDDDRLWELLRNVGRGGARGPKPTRA